MTLGRISVIDIIHKHHAYRYYIIGNYILYYVDFSITSFIAIGLYIVIATLKTTITNSAYQIKVVFGGGIIAKSNQ